MIIACDLKHIEELNEMISQFRVQITEHAFQEDPFSFYFAYQVNHELIGFINYSIMYERAELNYVYVKPEYRGTQVGSLLLADMVNRCAAKSVTSITLEVRSGNIPAMELYKKHGFEAVSIRKNYYQDEDGILMEKVL